MTQPPREDETPKVLGEISRWLTTFAVAKPANEEPTGGRRKKWRYPGGVLRYHRRMGSTYASLHCDIVFATKDRKPLITKQNRERLHAYIGGVIKGLDGIPEAVGGVDDHVHLVVGMKTTHCIADFVRDLKRRTTSWVQESFDADFNWQEGYAVFSVGVRGVPKVRNYVLNQEEHHRTISSLDELRKLLKEAGIPFEERFLE